ncbi:MAG: DUF2905 domain-containing protein [Marinilabiliaceae bacterium]|nr:DUF2905 domain-containing protein [Marinilabiliaceae bacterium]
MNQFGKVLILIGFLLMVAGVIFYFWNPKLHWLGNLPGDIRINKPHFKLYFPLTTLLLLSILISIIINILKRFF